jgi:hypothetical protein
MVHNEETHVVRRYGSSELAEEPWEGFCNLPSSFLGEKRRDGASQGTMASRAGPSSISL